MNGKIMMSMEQQIALEMAHTHMQTELLSIIARATVLNMEDGELKDKLGMILVAAEDRHAEHLKSAVGLSEADLAGVKEAEQEFADRLHNL